MYNEQSYFRDIVNFGEGMTDFSHIACSTFFSSSVSSVLHARCFSGWRRGKKQKNHANYKGTYASSWLCLSDVLRYICEESFIRKLELGKVCYSKHSWSCAIHNRSPISKCSGLRVSLHFASSMIVALLSVSKYYWLLLGSNAAFPNTGTSSFVPAVEFTETTFLKCCRH